MLRYLILGCVFVCLAFAQNRNGTNSTCGDILSSLVDGVFSPLIALRNLTLAPWVSICREFESSFNVSDQNGGVFFGWYAAQKSPLIPVMNTVWETTADAFQTVLTIKQALGKNFSALISSECDTYERSVLQQEFHHNVVYPFQTEFFAASQAFHTMFPFWSLPLTSYADRPGVNQYRIYDYMQWFELYGL